MTQVGRQKIGFGFIILGLIIIAIVIYLSFFNKEKEPGLVIDNNIEDKPLIEEDANTTPSDIPREDINYDISKEEEHVFNSSDLEKRSKFFAERFGTYSNQSDYSNFTELEMFMTKDFADWSKLYSANLKKNSPDFSSYYGISTRALTANIKKFDEEGKEAEIYVLTDRTETQGDLKSESRREGITLNFEKVGRDWLVDAAYWDKK